MSYNFPLFLPGKSEKPGFHCDISTGTGKSTTDTHSKRIKMQACTESIIHYAIFGAVSPRCSKKR